MTLIDIAIPALILLGGVALAKGRGNVVLAAWIMAACLGLSQCMEITH